MYKSIAILAIALLTFSCRETSLSVDKELDYCKVQVEKVFPLLQDSSKLPRNILSGGTDKNWNCTSIHDWTSGFWPGILWYVYENTKDEAVRKEAERFTAALFPVADKRPDNHDLGFMMYCSLGNGYRLTNNPEYKNILLRTADSLAVLYNPVVGTICSWPGMCGKMSWPHNTIIDNMINLELLFWASKNGGDKRLAEIATRHAEVTMKNQFRDDYSTCHVVVYDTITGSRMKQVTHQGYADSSMWARGQGWAIYGFSMCYRETGNPDFLKTAEQAADIYLANLPEDYVPYWDFNAPDIPNAPRDASAAALVASGLLELCGFTDDANKASQYKDAAVKMLVSLSSDSYQSRDINNAFLLHSTGHYPKNSEIDASIIYADYYYIEALTRLKKLDSMQK